jgi:hypothetical protein
VQQKKRCSIDLKCALYVLSLLGAAGVSAQPVACLLKGKMDPTRPEFPSVTCGETLAAGDQPAAKLREACLIPFGPWEIESATVPACPPKPLGSCFDVKDGQSSGASLAGVELPEPLPGPALTNIHHYTPQLPHEWEKTAKNCKNSGGKWVGPGSGTSHLGL